MPSATAIILLASLVDACGNEASNHYTPYAHNRLVDRRLKLSRLRCAELDDTALGKKLPVWECLSFLAFECCGCHPRKRHWGKNISRWGIFRGTIPSSALLRIWPYGSTSREIGIPWAPCAGWTIEMPDVEGGTFTFADFYKIRSGIDGEGSSGVVRPGYHRKTGMECAVKLVGKATATKRYIAAAPRMLEWQLRMSQINRTNNVVRYQDMLESNEYYFVIMERLRGRDLFEHVIVEAPRLTETFCRGVMHQAFVALRFLHVDHGVIHRDVKVENFRYRNPQDATSEMTLLDFGQMCFIDEPWDTGIVGTVPYLAPEISKAHSQPEFYESESPYSTAVDLWAAGVMMFILLTGEDPLTEKQIGDLGWMGADGRKLVAKALQHERLRRVSREAVDLLEKLLNVSPKDRITAVQALEHPWFSLTAVGTKPLAVPRGTYRTTSLRKDHRTITTGASIFQ